MPEVAIRATTNASALCFDFARFGAGAAAGRFSAARSGSTNVDPNGKSPPDPETSSTLAEHATFKMRLASDIASANPGGTQDEVSVGSSSSTIASYGSLPTWPRELVSWEELPTETCRCKDRRVSRTCGVSEVSPSCASSIAGNTNGVGRPNRGNASAMCRIDSIS